MERMIRYCLLVLLGLASLSAGSKKGRSAKPIDYVVTTKASIMTIALNGDVSWSEVVDGTSVTITIAGSAEDFIVKRMNYSFRDGAIKTFAMAPAHPDTERIVIALRKEQQYRIYQSPSSGRLNIEFFTPPGTVAAAKPKTRVTEPQQKSRPAALKTSSGVRPVDTHSPKNSEAAVTAPVQSIELNTATEQASMTGRSEKSTLSVEPIGTSALLLLFASMIIISGGGIALAYVLIKRKENSFRSTVPPLQSAPEPVVHRQPDQKHVEHAEEEFELAVEYAEQYLRSQGEFELQQRLEKLNSSSMQRKLERVAAVPGKGTNTAAAAEKLGISVGEVELASRLQKLQDRQITEHV